MARKHRATLADVAARVGMSITSVSVALNDDPRARLAPESVERIKEAARELGYRPNKAAVGLRTGKTNTVAFLSDDVAVTRYASGMIVGALEVADAQEHTVLIAETGNRPERIRAGMRAMLEQRPDGVIMALMGAKQIDVPQTPPGLRVVMANSTSSAGHPCVLPDEFNAGYDVVAHLLHRGHRRIGLIGYSAVFYNNPRLTATIDVRYAGIEKAFGDAGLAPVGVVEGGVWEPELGYAGTRQLLDSGEQMTALICLNDRVAFGAYQALGQRGVRIPQDLSVISFDDEAIASYVRPALTSARLPYEAMGRRAMELVLQPEVPQGKYLVPMPLQIRGSVAYVRS